MRKLIAVSMVITVLLGSLAGCGGDSQTDSNAGDTAQKDSIVVGIDADATSMDPLRISDTVSMSILSNVYETLVRMTPESEIIPGAAETWDISEDGTEYIFHLREGMSFHNGDPVTANDVKYSLDQAVESSYSGPYLGFVESTEVIDESKVKVKLKYAYAPFLSLCATYSNIVKEAFYEDGGTVQSKQPIGSGPYKFVAWENGDKIIFEAFEDYYAGVAPIKNLTYKIIVNSTTAAIAIEKGEVDMFINVAPADVKTLEGSEKLIVDQAPSSAFYFLGLNTENEILSDVKVRQAIAMSIDRESLIYGVLDGSGIEARSFIAEGLPGYTENYDPLPYDVEKATALLAEAGYPNGLDLVMTVPESRSEHAQMIQADVKKIGIELEISIVESGKFWEDLENSDYEMMMMGWSYVVMDPDVGFYSLYQSEEIIAGNYVRLNDEKLDELLLQGRISSDETERDAVYRKAEDIAMNSAAYIPIYWRNTIIAYNSSLQGVKIPPCGFYFIYDYSWGA